MKQTLDKLLSSGIVAVIRRVEPAQVDPLVRALIRGGVSGIEITLDSSEATKKIFEMKQRYGTEAVIGAGTVVNKSQAKEALAAGAEFIFSPILDKETITYTKEQNKIVIPGVFSPTEVYQGYIWGADVVKIYPANILGAQYIKDLNGPIPNIPKMPTGGVNLDNIGSFIKAGAVAAGVGGSLLHKTLIKNENWEQLQSLAKNYVEKVKEAKWGVGDGIN